MNVYYKMAPVKRSYKNTIYVVEVVLKTNFSKVLTMLGSRTASFSEKASMYSFKCGSSSSSSS